MIERIVRHPNVYERLVTDLCQGNQDYLDAVIKETLRLRPVLSIVARYVKKPITLNTMAVPSGVTLVPSIYLLHRRPDVYADPDQFRPERFLDTTNQPHTWIPFVGGSRRCLGASFATAEMKTVLTALLTTQRVTTTRSDSPEPIKRRGLTHVPGRGAIVLLANEAHKPASVPNNGTTRPAT